MSCVSVVMLLLQGGYAISSPFFIFFTLLICKTTACVMLLYRCCLLMSSGISFLPLFSSLRLPRAGLWMTRKNIAHFSLFFLLFFSRCRQKGCLWFEVCKCAISATPLKLLDTVWKRLVFIHTLFSIASNYINLLPPSYKKGFILRLLFQVLCLCLMLHFTAAVALLICHFKVPFYFANLSLFSFTLVIILALLSTLTVLAVV